MSWILISIIPSSIFQKMLLIEIYHQTCQAILGAVGMDDLHI